MVSYASRTRQTRRIAWLTENGPCRQCGSTEGLQIDHIDPLTKSEVISDIWLRPRARREAELAKCQVLCTPCHQNKTAEENRVHKWPRAKPEHTTFRKIVLLECAICATTFIRKARVEKYIAKQRKEGPYCSARCRGSGCGKRAWSTRNKKPEVLEQRRRMLEAGRQGMTVTNIQKTLGSKHEVIKRLLVAAGIPTRYHGESERQFQCRLSSWRTTTEQST